MGDDGRDYLRDAVDRLARSRKLRRYTSVGTGIECVEDYAAPPLLADLRDGIAGNIGAHAGSSMKAKIPLDAGALDLWNEIEAEVLDWSRLVGIEPGPEPLEQTLIRWEIAFVYHRGQPAYSDALEKERTRDLARWVRRIESMFNPVRTLELTRPGQTPVIDHRGIPVLVRPGHPPARMMTRDALVPEVCPVCEQAYGFLPKTGDRVTALVIEYRTTHEGTVEDVIARCRSCDSSWKGEQGVRELRYDLDHPRPKLEPVAG